MAQFVLQIIYLRRYKCKRRENLLHIVTFADVFTVIFYVWATRKVSRPHKMHVYQIYLFIALPINSVGNAFKLGKNNASN